MGLFDKYTKDNGNFAAYNYGWPPISMVILDDNNQAPIDICIAEYKKAISLAKDSTPEKVHQAYDIMNDLIAEFNYPPAITWMGDYEENVMKNNEQAAGWYKRAAELGDSNGSRRYADMLKAGKGVAKDVKLAIQYYAVAAEKGESEAAFILGEYLRDIGDKETALLAYNVALNGGYEPARRRIFEMDGGVFGDRLI